MPDTNRLFTLLLVHNCSTYTRYYGSGDSTEDFETEIIMRDKSKSGEDITFEVEEEIITLAEELVDWYLEEYHSGWETEAGGKGDITIETRHKSLNLDICHIEFVENPTGSVLDIPCEVQIPYEAISQLQAV